MFYGESQKLVKKAFDFYREMVEKSPVTPIFLMNEADGILSKRKSSDFNQGVQQTENAIQAILLYFKRGKLIHSDCQKTGI